MLLSEDEVKHIALLARIGLSDDEVERYRKDLSATLDWFAELRDVDTEGGALIKQGGGEANKSVPDAVVPSSPEERSAILENIPETKDGYVKVKSVF